MKGSDKQIHGRRNLLAGGLRLLTLGLFGAGAYCSIKKRNRLLREGKCIGDSICTRCKVFDDCGLPQALSAKQFFKRSLLKNGRQTK